MHRGLVAATTALAVLAATAAAPEERAELQQRLDDVVAAGAVGALAEVRDEHGIWRGTSGVAEYGGTRAVPVDGLFRAGSITKSLVSTVILQLVDEGELTLDDSVEAWLPGVVPGGGDRITVRHLLNNTSGLYDYVRTLPKPPAQEFFDNRWRTWTADELLQRSFAHPPIVDPPPGSVYEYSNTNYVLLGQIIEKITRRPYAHEIKRRIIQPLELRGTSMPAR